MWAVASGVLLSAAFPPAPLGFLAWFAFVPLLVALDRRVRAGGSKRSLFALGYVFGFAFYLFGIHWIALLSNVAITIPWLKYPAWVTAAAYLAVFSGLTTLLAGWLSRGSRVPLSVTFPLALLAIEELRASGEMGFPWFQPGYTQHAYVPLLQMASLGSVSLVTLWLGFLNVLMWRATWGGPRWRAAAGAALMLLLPWCWGMRVLDYAASWKPPGARVALVQANIPGEMKWSGNHQPEILATFLDLSARAAGEQAAPSLIVWPETATGSYLRRQREQATAVSAFASRTRVPVFSGAPDWEIGDDGKVRQLNGALLFSADGAIGPVYAKRHLVPFGERMPFQRLFPALGKLELGQAEWTPGTGTVLFPSAAGPFACLICFESIFPDLAREDVRRGARWLVNVTNDEWFGNSPALYQHAAMAPFRAVENHVPLARCANTGLTLFADATGRVTSRVTPWSVAVLSGAIAGPGPTTPFTRFGDWPGLLGLISVLGLSAVAARRALTGRARPAYHARGVASAHPPRLERRCGVPHPAEPMSLNVIVLGATGLVGKTMLRILEERNLPVGTLRPLASDRSASRTVRFRGHAHPVAPVAAEAFAGADLALFACANDVSQRWAPVAREQGVIVVDNSSAFRYHDDVPLVVPEVNGALLSARPPLVANPNCSTIALALALAPLARSAGLERVVVSTYQAVSGGGSETLDELERGVRAGLEGRPPARSDGGPPFAFNVVPHIDRFEDNGYTREEMKVVWETRKILGLPDLPVTATAVRVPVRVGHSASVNVTLARAMEPDEARALWAVFPGVRVVDDPGSMRYPMPLDAEGADDVLVGRVRRDISQARGIEFFVASDNLRKGAATNAVQIAERLVGNAGGGGAPAPETPGRRAAAGR